MRAMPIVALALLGAGVTSPAGAQEPGCTLVVTEDTTLDRDISCSDGAAIEIAAPGITLDLGGHTVTGGEDGIANPGFDRVTIRNGRLDTDGVGVSLTGAQRNVIEGLRLFTAIQSTIRLVDSDHNRIVGNRSSGYRAGIDLREGSDRNLVSGNSEGEAYGGTRVTDSDHNLIVGNRFRMFETSALVLTRSLGNRIAHNRLQGTYEAEVVLRASHGNTVSHNDISARNPASSPPPPAGVMLEDSNRNHIRHNSMTEQVTGLAITSGRRNLLARNRAFGNVGDGILIAAPALRSYLYANRAARNGDDGIDVRSAASWLVGNRAVGNGDLGIEAVPGTRAFGNSADGNGNAAQCLNVRCR